MPSSAFSSIDRPAVITQMLSSIPTLKPSPQRAFQMPQTSAFALSFQEWTCLSTGPSMDLSLLLPALKVSSGQSSSRCSLSATSSSISSRSVSQATPPSPKARATIESCSLSTSARFTLLQTSPSRAKMVPPQFLLEPPLPSPPSFLSELEK